MRPGNASRAEILLDVAGFLLGLGLAWALDWQTADLVWGLWLSSLVVGYASLLVGIVGIGGRERALSLHLLAGKLFLVVFFTFHFGLFHFVHSLFLQGLYPVPGAVPRLHGGGPGPGLDGYAQVFRAYWPWLCAAALAERASLLPGLFAPRPGRRTRSLGAGEGPGDGGAKPADGALLFRPYLNVMRMHLLLFFFLGAAAVGLAGFAVQAVVYAVYFLPWRQLLGAGRIAPAAGSR